MPRNKGDGLGRFGGRQKGTPNRPKPILIELADKGLKIARDQLDNTFKGDIPEASMICKAILEAADIIAEAIRESHSSDTNLT